MKEKMYKRYFEESDSVSAIFTDRLDGVSPEPYQSLNLGLNTGDNSKNVHENRNRVLREFNFTENSVAYADQCHSDVVSRVNSPKIHPRSDALITNQKNLALLIQVADCACIYLYDEKKQAIALVHSGWRGTQKKIVSKTIEKMKLEFSSEAHFIKAVISPCISKEFFEVGDDVYTQFSPDYFSAKENGKWLFDMKSCLKDELKSNGVQDIKIDENCTYKNKKEYFSYRRDANKSGRMMGLFFLK